MNAEVSDRYAYEGDEYEDEEDDDDADLFGGAKLLKADALQVS